MADVLAFIYSVSNDIQNVATPQFHALESLDFYPAVDIQTCNRNYSQEADTLFVIFECPQVRRFSVIILLPNVSLPDLSFYSMGLSGTPSFSRVSLFGLFEITRVLPWHRSQLLDMVIIYCEELSALQ